MDRTERRKERRAARRARPQSTRQREKPRPRVAPAEPAADIRLGKRGLLLLGLSVVVIAFGFVALALGSTVLAPILLVAGYLIGIPYALFSGRRGEAPAPAGAEIRPDPPAGGRP
jgi:hypothetical protein